MIRIAPPHKLVSSLLPQFSSSPRRTTRIAHYSAASPFGTNNKNNNNNNNNTPSNNTSISQRSVAPRSSPYPNTPVARRLGGGGGGSGRHQCPKCGTYVTFRHGDFEENTYYCAACSAWFATAVPATMILQQGTIPPPPPSSSPPTAAQRYHPPPGSPQPHPLPSQLQMMMAQHPSTTSSGGTTVDDTSSSILPPPGSMPTPKEVMQGLDQYVIGQRNVKMALAVGVYNHYKRLYCAEQRSNQQQQPPSSNNFSTVEIPPTQFGESSVSNTDNNNNNDDLTTPPEIAANNVRVLEDCEIEKSNIMLLGPSGSGKTLLVKTLAKLIDVPLVVADATCLTQAGYVGEDVESILFKLYMASGNDLERTQRGIIYIDEADKIRKSGGNISISRDVSGEGVQHALLKIVEGNVINVPKEPGRKNPRGDFLQIDSTNILFIAGGAFSGLERIINKRMDAASIGFGANMKKNVDDVSIQGRYFENAIPKDLVEYGMIPEFVGRFPVITTTKGLDLENLVDILTKPKNSLMKQYKRLFAMDDVDFHVTEDGLLEIAKIALGRGTGARGLRSITDGVLMETQFLVPSMPEVHTVFVNAAAVRGETKPVLLTDPEMTVEIYSKMLLNNETAIEGVRQVNLDVVEDIAA